MCALSDIMLAVERQNGCHNSFAVRINSRVVTRVSGVGGKLNNHEKGNYFYFLIVNVFRS